MKGHERDKALLGLGALDREQNNVAHTASRHKAVLIVEAQELIGECRLGISLHPELATQLTNKIIALSEIISESEALLLKDPYLAKLKKN